MQKHVLKALVLALTAALGLMAFVASSASAANLTTATLVHGKILVLNLTNLNASVTGTLPLGRLLVPSLNIEIHCASGLVAEASLTNPEGGEALGKFLFENCEVFGINSKLELTELLPCTISNGGVNHHITATATILVVTHEGVLYLVADPDPLTGPFATIEYEKGTGCPIPLKQEIKGTYAFTVTQEHLKVLSISPGNAALQTLLGTGLLYGINAASIDSAAGTATLTGAHKECTWGVV